MKQYIFLFLVGLSTSAYAMIMTNKSKARSNTFVIKSYHEPITPYNHIEILALKEKDKQTRELRFYIIIQKSAILDNYERSSRTDENWKWNRISEYNNFIDTKERIRRVLDNPEDTWFQLKNIYKVQKYIAENKNLVPSLL